MIASLSILSVSLCTAVSVIYAIYFESLTAHLNLLRITVFTLFSHGLRSACWPSSDVTYRQLVKCFSDQTEIRTRYCLNPYWTPACIFHCSCANSTALLTYKLVKLFPTFLPDGSSRNKLSSVCRREYTKSVIKMSTLLPSVVTIGVTIALLRSIVNLVVAADPHSEEPELELLWALAWERVGGDTGSTAICED
jgi:hypothetical protein